MNLKNILCTVIVLLRMRLIKMANPIAPVPADIHRNSVIKKFKEYMYKVEQFKEKIESKADIMFSSARNIQKYAKERGFDDKNVKDMVEFLQKAAKYSLEIVTYLNSLYNFINKKLVKYKIINKTYESDQSELKEVKQYIEFVSILFQNSVSFLESVEERARNMQRIFKNRAINSGD